MTRTTRIPLVVTSSATVAVATNPIHVDGNAMELHVLLAPSNVDFEGSLDAVTWVDLNYDNVAGAFTLTALNGVGAGYYKVHERPKYARLLVETDAGGPQDSYAVLIVKKESD